uniref:(northern house mosquito) hypothetical protein n=1 Tax=Culex pipiens TaxID=7175 RepID=A0A8D8BF62_CULPI
MLLMMMILAGGCVVVVVVAAAEKHFFTADDTSHDQFVPVALDHRRGVHASGLAERQGRVPQSFRLGASMTIHSRSICSSSLAWVFALLLGRLTEFCVVCVFSFFFSHTENTKQSN